MFHYMEGIVVHSNDAFSKKVRQYIFAGFFLKSH